MSWLHYIRYTPISVKKRDILNATTRKWKLGFNPNETWNLFYHLANHILPRLEHFKKVNIAYPGCMTSEEWDTELDKMIAAFRLLADENEAWLEIKDDRKRKAEYRKQRKIIKQGLTSFGKYFEALWW